ncbi:MAG TPA: hypothetical protein DIC60_04245 [Lachnospiraceae bacterium]|nr:hypothetical protein [Lachnospiraceae bacterium]
MDEFCNRHYIRLDLEGRIIKGFSDAFEQPIEGDICINEQSGRHFELFGVVNPPLMDVQGIYQYKYVDGVVSERTTEEIQADIANIPTVLSEQEQTNMAIAELTMMVASLL